MRARRGGEDACARSVARVGQPVMHIVRRVSAETAVPMFGVVPGEEVREMGTGIFECAKAFRKIGAVLERFEVRLGVRIVVRHVRA